eukprot:TRINITY_DN13972_c0_g1_i1.p1 TRINITY_DN13972_c0_g1~~TRINITY_DN13972_c0_g1_i1.p1  ORF type:complete len:260 (+),score=48.02 TRINITY_DN13972_c0_g1_i1:147-926(+)
MSGVEEYYNDELSKSAPVAAVQKRKFSFGFPFGRSNSDAESVQQQIEQAGSIDSDDSFDDSDSSSGSADSYILDPSWVKDEDEIKHRQQVEKQLKKRRRSAKLYRKVDGDIIRPPREHSFVENRRDVNIIMHKKKERKLKTQRKKKLMRSTEKFKTVSDLNALIFTESQPEERRKKIRGRMEAFKLHSSNKSTSKMDSIRRFRPKLGVSSPKTIRKSPRKSPRGLRNSPKHPKKSPKRNVSHLRDKQCASPKKRKKLLV